VDVTPRMAYNLIKVLQQHKVDYVVAPYEADAQLTYLSINGIADAVITEDSDLIPYGATRVRVFSRLSVPSPCRSFSLCGIVRCI
jgi:exonuclease-1